MHRQSSPYLIAQQCRVKAWESVLTARGGAPSADPYDFNSHAPWSKSQVLASSFLQTIHIPPPQPRFLRPLVLLTVQAGWISEHALQGLQWRVERKTQRALEFSGGEGSRLRRGGPGAGQRRSGFKDAAAGMLECLR